MSLTSPDRIEIATSLGPIWLNGRDRGRPAVLLLNGLYGKDRFAGIVREALPEIDLFTARLPGDGAPPTVVTSIGVHAAAYTQAIDAQFAGRPLLVVGISVGGLIATALRSPAVRRLLILDPPFLTGELWSLAEGLHNNNMPGWQALAWPLFGIDDHRHEARDYLPMLDALETPTVALVGADPLLPRRPFVNQPSLVDEHSRAVLAAHPQVRLRVVPGAGHLLTTRGLPVVMEELRLACAAVFGPGRPTS